MADDRVPLVLKFGDWPESDKELWATITAEGGFMEDRGPGATWSVGTRRTFQQGYGQWLSHLMRVEPSAILFDPLSRITEERMRIYLGELRARLKPRSQVNLVRSLLVLATAAAPEDDWVWLDRAIKRLVNAVSSVSVPPAKPITARQLFHQSLKRIGILLAQLEDRSPDRHQAIQFRQSLMIAFLIARPVRRRALLAMDIDRRLTRSGDGFRVSLEAGT